MKNRVHLTLVIITAVILVGVWLTAADTAKGSKGGYYDMVENFFTSIQAGDYGGAVDQLYANNPWISAKSDEIQQLRSQFLGLPDLVGAYKGHAKIWEVGIDGKFVYLNYLVAMERQPLSFKFHFYLVDNQYRIHSFAYNDDIEELLEEKARQKFYSSTI